MLQQGSRSIHKSIADKYEARVPNSFDSNHIDLLISLKATKELRLDRILEL
jgi:hypothetical protein